MNVFLNYRHVQFVKITLSKLTIFLYNFKYNEKFSLYLYNTINTNNLYTNTTL
ncbi:hypothetical protein IIV6-T1_194 [Invertebrate iridescent virus 6]|nr:hypothetical protein IIV6-T1_194 [Invertebrate iridescent virus 6]